MWTSTVEFDENASGCQPDNPSIAWPVGRSFGGYPKGGYPKAKGPPVPRRAHPLIPGRIFLPLLDVVEHHVHLRDEPRKRLVEDLASLRRRSAAKVRKDYARRRPRGNERLYSPG